MKLEDLLNDLEKQAGFGSDSSNEGKPTAGSEKDTGKGKSSDVSAEDKEKAKGDGVEKSASVATGRTLHEEIMEKLAGNVLEINSNSKGEQMNKQASEAGRALANGILQKLAGVGDTNSETGVGPTGASSKVIADNAAMVAEDNLKIKVMPGTDGMGDGGSINQIFDAVVADAMAQGAASHDQVHTQGVAGAEGAVNAQALPNQVQTGAKESTDADAVEKAAAVTALVNSGVDFDYAVDLVKAAEQSLLLDEENQIKQAALGELLEAGVNFDMAVALVKEASRASAILDATGKPFMHPSAAAAAAQAVGSAAGKAGAAAKGAGQSAGNVASNTYHKIKDAVGGYATDVARDAKAVPAQARAYGENRRLMKADPTSRNVTSGPRDALLSNKALRLGAGLGAAGAVGAAAHAAGREKKAALDMLCDMGVDFDQALSLVEAKSQELYGC